jgi:hypothetical protein
VAYGAEWQDVSCPVADLGGLAVVVSARYTNMKDTWTNSDLPVLEAAEHLLDTSGLAPPINEIAAATRLAPEAVRVAIRALEGRNYV